MAGRRVVVTGMGAITPLGDGVDTFWSKLVESVSGVGLVQQFDTDGFSVRIGAECNEFDPARYLDPKGLKRIDRFTQFALAASKEAVESSGLDFAKYDSDRVCVIYGSGIGGMNELEEQHTRLITKGPTRVSAFTIPKLMINAAAANISIEYGLTGVSLAVATACASATNAMGEAFRFVRNGFADVALTGGSEAALTPLSLAAFASMKALSSRHDAPEQASRPFDRDRDGFVLGEGCATLIFEELEHAKKRGAPILAEVFGYGASSDAGHITQPAEDGVGAAKAMCAALTDANLNPEDLDYINAHGTGTPLGDKAESVAIRRVFGETADKLVVSSTKSAIGHLLGASGAVELVASINAIRNSTIPPTLNLDNPGEGCDLDFCPNTARDRAVRTALSSSFGFGGHDACLVVSRFDG